MAAYENTEKMVKLVIKRRNGDHGIEIKVPVEVAKMLQSEEIDGRTKQLIINSYIEGPRAAEEPVPKMSTSKKAPAAATAAVVEEEEDHVPLPVSKSKQTAAVPPPHIWTPNEEKALWEIRPRMESSFNKAIRHDKLWNDISQELADLGYSITGAQCKWKWKNAKKKYSEFKDRQNQTGQGRETQPAYFETFDEMYGARATMKPKRTRDSMLGQGRAGNVAGEVTKEQPVAEDLDIDEPIPDPPPNTPKKPKKTTSDRLSPVDKVVQMLSQQDERQEGFQKMMQDQHAEKMQRMDRYLDLMERSMTK